jgi:hypothetical protein
MKLAQPTNRETVRGHPHGGFTARVSPAIGNGASLRTCGAEPNHYRQRCHLTTSAPRRPPARPTGRDRGGSADSEGNDEGERACRWVRCPRPPVRLTLAQRNRRSDERPKRRSGKRRSARRVAAASATRKRDHQAPSSSGASSATNSAPVRLRIIKRPSGNTSTYCGRLMRKPGTGIGSPDRRGYRGRGPCPRHGARSSGHICGRQLSASERRCA